jgi:hypothetical protein
MIVYDLLCENAHRFEGWFASAEAFAHQHDAGQLVCPVCGSTSVHKPPSAPYVQTGASSEGGNQSLMANAEFFENMRRKFVEFILQNTEDVGTRFPQEARAIHNGEAAERAIRGQASAAEAKQLRDEGIEVIAMPVPVVPKDKLH